MITDPRLFFKSILPQICTRDTSIDPKGWRKNNPLWGHCAVVSLLAQSLFSGQIYAVNLKGTKFAKMKHHYWNAFPDGTQEDFTREQFGRDYPGELKIRRAIISSMLDNPNTLRRFEWLRERFEDESKKDE